MPESTEIAVPRINASDDTVLIREWLHPSGHRVRAGDIIAVCESSKAAFEVTTPTEGFLHYRAEVGSDVPVGSTLAVVSEQLQYEWPAAQADTSERSRDSELQVSGAARALMDSHGLTAADLTVTGLITRTDVEAHLAGQALRAEPAGQTIVVVGGGGHGRVCIDILRRRPEFQLIGVVDDTLAVGEEVLGVPVLGPLDLLPRLHRDGTTKAVVGIGAVLALATRLEVCERVRATGFELPPLIHTHAIIESSARVGGGVQVFGGAVVGSAVRLHEDSVVNSGAIVSHDSEVGRNSHLAPGAILAGGVVVGDNTVIGMGATIFLGVRIGSDVTIHNGANVVHDVPDGTTVAR